MTFENIKNKVNNFENCSIEEIDSILNFIAIGFRKKYNFDFDFTIEFEEGACVKHERNLNGLQQVEIGNMKLALIKTDKDLGLEVDLNEEKKEFVELILSTFHELRHVVQNYYIQDRPTQNEKTLMFTQEKIINEVFPGFITYNYEQSAVEIDAMMSSLVETVSFFRSMNFDISKDEVLEIMKEKELAFCNYCLNDFGNSYDSALEYFGSIIADRRKINELDNMLKSFWEGLDDPQKSKVSKLVKEVIEDKNIDSQLNILEEISLIIKPELKETYPLYNIKNQKSHFKR